MPQLGTSRQASTGPLCSDENDNTTVLGCVDYIEFPQHGERIDELVALADKALYSSKNSGRNLVAWLARKESAR